MSAAETEESAQIAGKQQSKKTVSFPTDAVSEVKEIPRRTSNQAMSGFQNVPMPTTSTVPVNRASITPRTFDSSVFTGIVKERPVGKKSFQDKPKKKLSKFAQERMQNS